MMAGVGVTFNYTPCKTVCVRVTVLTFVVPGRERPRGGAGVAPSAP